MSSTPNLPETESYACPKCPKEGFKTLGAVRTHFSAKDHDLHCTICNGDFPTVKSFVAHHRQKHLNSGKPSRPPRQVIAKTAAADSKNPQATMFPNQEFIETAERTALEYLLPKRQIVQCQLPERPATKPTGQGPFKKANQARQNHSTPSVLKSSSHARSFSTSSIAVVDKIRTDPDRTQSIHRHIVLHVQEQELIFQGLWTRCHSPALLVAEGYKLSAASVKRKTYEKKAYEMKINEKKVPPPIPVIPPTSFVATPKHLPSQTQKKRRAVVLDCEMVQVEGNCRELAYLTAVDFLTNEILINNYVQPTKRVVGWNTRYSGISCAEMNRARVNGRALWGWNQARQVLWEYVDSDTVLIGHSLENDLKVLGFYHSKIVDSQILTSQAVALLLPSDQHLTRRWGLKTLTKELLEDNIQVGKKGHSALEDTRATRDVVIWCIRNPEPLSAWAKKARDEEVRRILEEKRKNDERRKKKEEEKKKKDEAEEKLKAGEAQLQASAA